MKETLQSCMLLRVKNRTTTSTTSGTPRKSETYKSRVIGKKHHKGGFTQTECFGKERKELTS